MAAERKERLGAGAWQDNLRKVMEKGVPDAKGVPEGYCRTGCGRPVAPGFTACGNKYRTCCRGCIMGFGHDLYCGNIDAELLGEGMCRNGCGRKVAEGTQTSGRPFTTCCKGCAMGSSHSPECGAPARSRASTADAADGGETTTTPADEVVKSATEASCSVRTSNSRNSRELGRASTASSNASSKMCKMGCGRKVCRPSGGKRFDTCCRSCAKGQG